MTRQGPDAGTPTRLGIALKQSLRTTPLAKVKVSALASAAGISRQAFYYHFSSVNDLAVWVFQNEIAAHIMAHASYAAWPAGFTRLLAYMRLHKSQTYAVIDSLSHEELESFFFATLHDMMAVIVAELEGDLVLSDESRAFVIEHFTLSVLGHLLHWFANDMQPHPRILVANIEKICRGAVRASLERFAVETPPDLVRSRSRT